MSFFQDWVNTGSFSAAYFYRVSGSNLANQWSFAEPPIEKPGKAKGGFFGIFSFINRREADRRMPGLADTISRGQNYASRENIARQNQRWANQYEEHHPNYPPINNLIPPGHQGVPYWDDPNQWGPGI